MATLQTYRNPTPLNMTKDEIDNADDVLQKMISSLDFFRHILTTPRQKPVNMTESHTYMGLFESYFKELSPLVRYDSVLTEELNNRYQEIRELHTEIEQLKAQLGSGTTPEGVSAALQHYDDILRCFYGALGFQYVRLDNLNSWNMTVTFTHELQYEPDAGYSRNKEFSQKCIEHFDIISRENTPFDIYRDSYHAELLDTDNNKQLIQNLILQYFPNARFHSFKGRRNDFESFSSEFTVALPFTDLDNLYHNIMDEPAENTDDTTELSEDDMSDEYFVVFVVKGHIPTKHSNIGSIYCNGVIPNEEGTYDLKDGRIDVRIEQKNAASPEDAYELAKDMTTNFDSTDIGETVIDTISLEHIEYKGNYLYLEDLRL